MRFLKLCLLIVLCLLPVSLHAQDNRADSAYAEALYRIEGARVGGGKELNLSGLGLVKLPPEIGQLVELQILRINKNQLRSLPREIGQLTALTWLNADNNQLSSLPPEIGQLINLQTLDLDTNLLPQLPPEIGALTSLQYLNLHVNRLSSLPPQIGALTSLQHLNIANNQLTGLPAEIDELSNLCYLNINYNRFQHLPTELRIRQPASPTCISIIELYDNPLITPPREVIAQGTPAILVYLREQAWYHTRQLLFSASGGIGFGAAVILGLRWRYRRLRKSKKKRDTPDKITL